MELIRKMFLGMLLVFVTYSCDSSKKESKLSEKIKVEVLENEQEQNVSLNLLKQKCYVCHSVTSKSHDEIIAPPMVAVVRRYKMSYKDKDAFVKAVTNYVLNPTSESALMFGAVKQFNVMPKQPFEKKDIIKISEYIFENELESPEWFDSHFETEHPNGMMGKGRGKQMKSN